MTFRIYLPVEFDGLGDALAYFDEMREKGMLPRSTELYRPDGVDKDRHKISDRDLIVRSTGDREWGLVRDEVNGKS